MRAPNEKFNASLGAAVIGAISLFLPWAAFTVSNGTASATSGQSPVQLLLSLISPYRPPSITDYNFVLWQRGAEVGTGVWVIGSLLVVVGCVSLVGQAYSSIRWAGVWLASGTILGFYGIESFSASFPFEGYMAYVGLSPWIVVPIIASIIGLLPLIRPDPLDLWVLDLPKSFGLPGQEAPTKPGVSVDPGRGPEPVHSDSVPTEAPGTRRFCPTCGRWYLGGEVECDRDHASLKPIPD